MTHHKNYVRLVLTILDLIKVPETAQVFEQFFSVPTIAEMSVGLINKNDLFFPATSASNLHKLLNHCVSRNQFFASIHILWPPRFLLPFSMSFLYSLAAADL